MSDLTDRQKLADLSTDWGLPKIMLRAYEELIEVKITSTTCVVLIRRYRTQETAREVRFIASGQLMRWFTRNQYNAWVEQDPMMTWDEVPQVPARLAKFQNKTPQEVRESELWAADCHRPGTKRFPMENFDVTAVRCNEAPAAMSKHWGLS